VACSAASSAAVTEAVSVMSHLSAMPPISAGDLLRQLEVHVEHGDLGARRASSRAVAAPRPEAPPVTRAAWSGSS
jgi:hypothetical protein